MDDVLTDLRAYAAQAKAIRRSDAEGIKSLESKVRRLTMRIARSSDGHSPRAKQARQAVRQLLDYLKEKPYEGDTRTAIASELSPCERAVRSSTLSEEARKAIAGHMDQLTLRIYRLDASPEEKGALHGRIADVRRRLKAYEPPKEDEKDKRGPLPVSDPLDMQKFTGKRLSVQEKIEISERVGAIAERYSIDRLPKPINVGRELEFSVEQAKRLLVDADRFVREFHATAARWRKDKAEALRIYRETDAGWFHASQLGSTVPYSLNGLVWKSRFYLEAVHDTAYRVAEHRLGKKRLVIINGLGPPAVTFDWGGTTEQCVQFTYHAAHVGHFFAERIGDDPAPWLDRQQEVEALAKEYSIPLVEND